MTFDGTTGASSVASLRRTVFPVGLGDWKRSPPSSRITSPSRMPCTGAPPAAVYRTYFVVCDPAESDTLPSIMIAARAVRRGMLNMDMTPEGTQARCDTGWSAATVTGPSGGSRCADSRQLPASTDRYYVRICIAYCARTAYWLLRTVPGRPVIGPERSNPGLTAVNR